MALPAVLLAMGRTAAAAGSTTAAGGAAASRMQPIIGAVMQLGQQSQTAAHQVSGLGSKISGMSGKLVGAFTQILDLIEHAAGPVKSLVALNNPGQAERFELAMKNAYAVVGHSLIPVLDAFSKMATMVGDRFAGLEGKFQRPIAAVVNVVNSFSKVIDKVLSSDAVMNAFAFGIETIANSMAMAIKVFDKARDALMSLTKIPLFDRLIRSMSPDMDPNKKANGFYVQSVDMMQPKGISDEAIRNSLKVGLGDSTKSTEEYAKNIDKTLEDMFKWITNNIVPGMHSYNEGKDIGESFGSFLNQFLVGGL